MLTINELLHCHEVLLEKNSVTLVLNSIALTCFCEVSLRLTSRIHTVLQKTTKLQASKPAGNENIMANWRKIRAYSLCISFIDKLSTVSPLGTVPSIRVLEE